MSLAKFRMALDAELRELEKQGVTKSQENVIVEVIPGRGTSGPRVRLEGQGDREFLRMNANNYLGLATNPRLIEAEERAAHAFGVGPGAVRFIAGTYRPHVELEEKLAKFHGREAVMVTSAAYTSVLGVLVSLTTPESILISDELNHNCIINGMKLSRPKARKIYRHLDLGELERLLAESVGEGDNVLVITDGVFSMRGDIAPLGEMERVVHRFDGEFPRGILLVVDDSHGVGAIGDTGRGTEELMGGKADILIATLGKALGVNGGYIATDATIVRFLREKNPLYIYTNPITPSEAATAAESLGILDSAEGQKLLLHLRTLTKQFEGGLVALGFETIPSPHPVVPLLVRDTQRTRELVAFLREKGILATGLSYPVVPKGEELIRFQISAEHTPDDIDMVLGTLKSFAERGGIHSADAKRVV